MYKKSNLLELNEKPVISALQRTDHNPILKPRADNPWESQFVFNPATIYLNDKMHFIYRAIGESGLSVFGYAASKDGIHIDERSSEPAYICSGPLPKKQLGNCSSYCYLSGASWSGCEDPRLTKIGDMIYMTYTAFSSWNSPPGVALTSISVTDFLAKKWDWKQPVLLSPPNEMHKNWVIFPEKINGKYAVLHSVSPDILIDYFDTMDFDGSDYIESHYQSSGRGTHWDNWMRGVAAPPIKTKEGWLVLYHAMDKQDPNKYKLGAMILDSENPQKILYRCNTPLLEPTEWYENEGYKAGVIYVCGASAIDNTLFVYYGGADTVVCAATANLDTLLSQIKHNAAPTFQFI